MKFNIQIPEFLVPFYSADLIRIGKGRDGSYLVERNSIVSSDILLSFGVSSIYDFEKDFLNYKKVPIVAFDGQAGISSQLKKIKWRILQSIKQPSFIYFKESFDYFLVPFKFYSFYKPIHFNKVSKSSKIFVKKNVGNKLNQMSIEEIFDFYLIKNKFKNAFLQIDIEGGEYDILIDLLKIQNLLSGLVIEFHDVDKNLSLIENFIKNFRLHLVHFHINNFGGFSKNNTPKVIELTFSTKSEKFKVNKLPHELDFENSIDNSYQYKFSNFFAGK